MQAKKHNKIDSALCDRFIEVMEEIGIHDAEVAKECKLKSRTTISEIRRHVIEPSKRMILWMLARGYSGHWILTGKGPERWSDVAVIEKENVTLKTRIHNMMVENEKQRYEIAALKMMIKEFVKGKK
jgi:hypothetical protein